MTERITFSVTLLRDDALHLQEAANEGGLLLSEYAARCLASIAEDDRRAHDVPVRYPYKPLYHHEPATGVIRLATAEELSSHPGIDIAAEDTGIPGHPDLRLVDDECRCSGCKNARAEEHLDQILARGTGKGVWR